MQINGSCHCGAVSFTADVDPSCVMLCHCTDCQVLSGSAFRTVVMAPFDTFAIRGKTKSYVKVAASGNRRGQFFCPECGTPLYGADPDKPTTFSIRLGCVKERAQLKPAAQIWHHSAMPWLSGISAVRASAEQQAMLMPSAQ